MRDHLEQEGQRPLVTHRAEDVDRVDDYPMVAALALVPVILVRQNLSQRTGGVGAAVDQLPGVLSRHAIFFFEQQINQFRRRHLRVLEHPLLPILIAFKDDDTQRSPRLQPIRAILISPFFGVARRLLIRIFSCLTFSCRRKSDRKMSDRKMSDGKMVDRKMAERKLWTEKYVNSKKRSNRFGTSPRTSSAWIRSRRGLRSCPRPSCTRSARTRCPAVTLTGPSARPITR